MPRNEASIDLDHLARLANLPLNEDERDALHGDCQSVLDAFQIPEHDYTPQASPQEPYFQDDPDPTPQDAVDKILDEVPRRDGRHIQA